MNQGVFKCNIRRCVIHLRQYFPSEHDEFVALTLQRPVLCYVQLCLCLEVRTFLGWVIVNGKHEGKADDAGNTQTRQGMTSKKPLTSKHLNCESCCAVVFPEKSKHFCIWRWCCPKLSPYFNMTPQIYLNKEKRSRRMVFKELLFDIQSILCLQGHPEG